MQPLPSIPPLEEAAILTIDGVGEWATTTLASGKGKHVESSRKFDSLTFGLALLNDHRFCGFRVNSGEYKLMGLAPTAKRSMRISSGESHPDPRGWILSSESGLFRLSLLRSDGSPKIACPAGRPPRQLTPPWKNVSWTSQLIQAITEEIMTVGSACACGDRSSQPVSCRRRRPELRGQRKIPGEGVFGDCGFNRLLGMLVELLSCAGDLSANERKHPPSPPKTSTTHGALLARV